MWYENPFCESDDKKLKPFFDWIKKGKKDPLPDDYIELYDYYIDCKKLYVDARIEWTNSFGSMLRNGMEDFMHFMKCESSCDYGTDEPFPIVDDFTPTEDVPDEPFLLYVCVESMTPVDIRVWDVITIKKLEQEHQESNFDEFVRKN